MPIYSYFGAGSSGSGDPGDSAYVYIAYASDDQGADFSLTVPNDYVAILSTDTEIAAPEASDFAGLWKKIKGEDGEPGDSAYVYIAYASSAAGADFTLAFDPDLDYIAILSTTEEISSPAVGDFAGLWKNYKGADGEGSGGTSAPLAIDYAAALQPDCEDGLFRKVTLAGDMELDPPTNPSEGMKFEIWITCDGSARNLAIDAAILVPTDSMFTSPKALTASKTYVVMLRYGGTAWWLVSVVGGL